ncbi:MAG: hypothetical protein CSA42_01640 [Gammaproteobacteria bacterium]|nr:MAG: hypothetical protein CSA42_01640 [Gammaproteobacteria bacterium]
MNTNISEQEKFLLQDIGYKPDTARAGTCVIVDAQVKYSNSSDDMVVVMPLQQALITYDWVQDLMFKLISPDENEHVKQASELIDEPIGHFVYIKEGANVNLPIQTFSILETPQGRQFTHNIMVIGKNAKVNIISGSTVPNSVHAGHHISINETYIYENAELRSLSVEHWGKNMKIDSYSRTQIGKNATAIDTEIVINPTKHHFTDSKTYVAMNATNQDESIVFAPSGSHRIMNSEIYLQGEGAHSESISRMVSAGGSITNNACLIGDASNSKGFLGCDGLKLNDEGEILSTPALLARNYDAQLSHEASIGMISADKVAYLMASGMSEDSARSLLIKGFLNLNERDLPDNIKASVLQMIEMAKSGSM